MIHVIGKASLIGEKTIQIDVTDTNASGMEALRELLSGSVLAEIYPFRDIGVLSPYKFSTASCPDPACPSDTDTSSGSLLADAPRAADR